MLTTQQIGAALLFGGALLLNTFAPSQEPPPYNRAEPAEANNRQQPNSEAITPSLTKQKQREGQQEANSGDSIKATDWLLALFTLFLVVYTRRLYQATAGLKKSTDLLWDATKNIAGDARIGRERTERAYIRMSHPREFDDDPSGGLQLNVEVKNLGRTPARIIDVALAGGYDEDGGPPPSLPEYALRAGRPIPRAFLLTNDSFIHSAVFPLTRQQLDRAKAGAATLWVCGFADYRDIFGRRHRVGYGRVIDHTAGRLVFITSDAYNYERPRVPGEGDDWDQTS